MRSWLLIAMLAPLWSLGQLDSAVVHPIPTLQTDQDELLCCQLGSNDFLLARSKAHPAYLSDLSQNRPAQFDLWVGKMEGEQTHWQPFEVASALDEGTAYFHAPDSTLWFSSSATLAGDKGRNLRLYWCQKKADGWGPIHAFMHNDARYQQCHPWMDETGEHLFFSTDKVGGAGGMDIWYSVKFADGWSQPIWAGGAINTAGNELFPTLHGNQLFFSSDGQPGAERLDLFTADGDRHWQAVQPLPSPINSAGDDLQLVFTTADSGYLTSNRDSVRGDDVFAFTFLPKTHQPHGYTAVLQCKGTPLQKERVEIYLKDGTLVCTEVTATSGELDISSLDLNTPYVAKATDLDPLILPYTLIYIKNAEGVIVQIISLVDDGFVFELLPYDGLDLPLMENPDNSILAIDLEGQIFREAPGDVGRGHPVYILSKEGELLSLAYTKAAGHFRVDDLRPLTEYTIQLDESSKAQQIQVMQDGEPLVIPLTAGVGDFKRLRESEVISLKDEFNQPIQVAADDVFILKNIYYSFDQFELNPVAKAQLKDLAAILKNNPTMGIELSSHTDSRGTTAYNLNLSEQRANAAVAFLASLGIESHRLKAKGYGESQILNGCTDGVNCSDLEHALNRRTELRMFFE